MMSQDWEELVLVFSWIPVPWSLLLLLPLLVVLVLVVLLAAWKR